MFKADMEPHNRFALYAVGGKGGLVYEVSCKERLPLESAMLPRIQKVKALSKLTWLLVDAMGGKPGIGKVILGKGKGQKVLFPSTPALKLRRPRPWLPKAKA